MDIAYPLIDGALRPSPVVKRIAFNLPPFVCVAAVRRLLHMTAVWGGCHPCIMLNDIINTYNIIDGIRRLYEVWRAR